MHQQSSRQIQTTTTSASPTVVIAEAVRFFTRENGIYAAFVEKQGPSYVVLRGQGGEEIAIGAQDTANGTSVSGSSYLFDQQIARFLTLLPPAPPPAPTPAIAAGDADAPALPPAPAGA